MLIGVVSDTHDNLSALRKALAKFKAAGATFVLHFGPHELELAGRRITLMHEPWTLEGMAASGRYHLLVYGDTHKIDLREGSVGRGYRGDTSARWWIWGGLGAEIIRL